MKRLENDDRWNELCALAAGETDPVKRSEIVKEIGYLFKDRHEENQETNNPARD